MAGTHSRFAQQLLIALLAFNASGPSRAQTAATAPTQRAVVPATDAKRGVVVDIETHLGCVPENSDPVVAAANAQKINDALDAMHRAGSAPFAGGQAGPVLYTLTAPAKEFFVLGELRTAPRVGGAFHGSGGRSYQLGTQDYARQGIGGAVTRITRIDGEKGGAVLLLRGAGFDLQNIELRGRPLPGNAHSAKGSKTLYGIALEGRVLPSSGKHTINNVTVSECQKALACLDGYFDDQGKFIRTQNHADETYWGTVIAAGCDTVFYSENINAVGQHFANLQVGIMGESNPEVVVFDVVRGGNIKCDYLILNHPRATIFRVWEYSHNTDSLVVSEFRDDTMPAGGRLTLFEFAGEKPEAYKRWRVRISGHIANAGEPTPYDANLLLKLNGLKPDIWLDINHLPEAVAKQYPWGGRR